MARLAPFASPFLDRVEPAGIDLAIDLLELAERDDAADLLPGVAERLQRAFGACFVVGLLLDGRTPPQIDGDPPAAGALRLALAAFASRLRFAVVADDGGARPVAAGALLDRFSGSQPCPWATVALDDRQLVLAMHLPSPATLRVAESQRALSRLVGALAARYCLAGQRRRRLDRVATLSTMLADIASHLDLDEVLTTIVERARDLVGSDAAYLAEVDEATRTVSMRLTTGIDDAGYKRGRVALGKGLAGAVAASRRAMVTRDYLADPRFVHTSDTDANVIREGIHGAIVAPLLVRGRILGVLGVANHRPTEFAADDVELVQNLADGAAIALDNARLYAVQTRHLAQLRDLYALTSRQHESLKRSVRLHDRLTELVLQGHGREVIVQRLATLIANPVVLLGPYFNLIDAAGIDAAAATTIAARIGHAPRVAPDLARLPVERRPIHLAPGPVLGIETPLILAPVMAGPDLLGYVLAIEARQEFDPLDFQALEQAATVFALALTRERVVAEVENRLRGDFVHDLVTGAFDQATIVRRANGLGHDLTLPQLILAVAADPPRDRLGSAPRGDQIHRLEQALRTACGRRSLIAQTSVIGDVIVTLLALPPQTDHGGARLVVDGVRHELGALLGPVGVSLGLSRIHRSPAALARAHQEALQALRTGQRLGRRGAVTRFDDLGVERLLAQLPDPEELASYVDATLGPLLAYDAGHGTDLLTTLETHLGLGCRQRATAAILGIHVNSLQYRLRRIAEIGALSLEDAETRLNLQLALRGRLLLRATDSEPGCRTDQDDGHPARRGRSRG